MYTMIMYNIYSCVHYDHDMAFETECYLILHKVVFMLKKQNHSQYCSIRNV